MKQMKEYKEQYLNMIKTIAEENRWWWRWWWRRSSI